MVTVAAALLSGAALAGCGLVAAPDGASVTPPADAGPPAVVAPPPAVDRQPLSPPVEVPLPPVPRVVGPYVPGPVVPPPSETPGSGPTPPATAAPRPPAPTSTPEPEPSGLLALLSRAVQLPPLTWATDDGQQSAPWAELIPPRSVAVPAAIAHVAAARTAGSSCEAAADAVDGAALEAAAVSLAVDPAPGAPFDLVLLRYETPEAAAEALAALQRLGTACAGVATDDGVLAAGDGATGPTVVLRADDAVLVAESAIVDALLVAVLHEGAPPEAVAALLALPG